MKNWLKFALTSFFLFACSRPQVQHARYAEADWTSANKGELILDIFATNNFSGNLQTQAATFPDGSASPIHYGGASLLLGYRSISQERSEAHSLWLDAGGVFDPLSDVIHRQESAQVLKRMNYDAVAFTEKELATVGPNPPTDGKVPFVNSHLVDLASGAAFENQAVKPWRIIDKSGLRIGVIAVTDYNSVSTEAPEMTRGLYFEDTVLGVLRAKKDFARERINFTILLAHVESACHADEQQQITCPSEGDELTKLLLRLPPNSIDLVIASPNRIASGVIQNIPVIMAPGRGMWLARARVHFDAETKALKKDNTELLSPIQICDQFYNVTSDCHIPQTGEATEAERVKLLKQSKQELRPAKFWGHEVVPDPSIEKELRLIRIQGNLSH